MRFIEEILRKMFGTIFINLGGLLVWDTEWLLGFFGGVILMTIGILIFTMGADYTSENAPKEKQE